MNNTSQHDLSISDLFAGDMQLASPPSVYFQLQKVIENPNKTVADAADVIEKDAGLTIRLLKIVNSAFYGFPAQIASVDRAINLIGTKELQNIVLGTIVIDRFSKMPNDLISMYDFWANNLRCALIAQGIDQYLGNKNTDSIFVCGILHNIGQLVFYRRIPELANEVALLLQAGNNPSGEEEILIEQTILGFDHFETGAALTKLWKLPEVIVESIRLHTDPESTEEYSQIATMLRLANGFSRLDDMPSENSLNIPVEDMSEIIDSAHEQFEQVFKLFYPG